MNKNKYSFVCLFYVSCRTDGDKGFASFSIVLQFLQN